MEKQAYKNHIRYYLPHHVFFYLCVLLLTAISANGIFHHNHHLVWIALTALSLMVGWLSFMTRQHYALICQNRIVRLEMRFRYYVLTGQRLEAIEKQISFKQLAALRFASDGELDELIKRTINEQLSPDDIKKTIIDWQPDYMRV